MVLDRVSSPLGHNLMLRPDLKGKITDLKQLKGKVIATNGQRRGLDLRGRQDAGDRRASPSTTSTSRCMPFTQMAVAFSNKAIDAAIVIPPFTAQLIDGGFAVNFADPDDW